MKTIKSQLLVIISVLFFSLSMQSQEIIPPSEGKAVVYFVRTSQLGFLINFKYFHNNKYIGKFKGTNFLRYESDPGKNIFWIKSENIDYVEAELEEGEVYFIETNAKMGAIKAAAKIQLVNYNDPKQMERIMSVLKNKDGKTFSDTDLENSNKKMQSMITRSSLKINKKRKKKKGKVITPEMHYIKN